MRHPSVNPDMRDQLDLCREHGRQLDQLERDQAAELEALRAKQIAAVLELRRRHTIELVLLWKKQGRTLGPAAREQLEEGAIRGSSG